MPIVVLLRGDDAHLLGGCLHFLAEQVSAIDTPKESPYAPYPPLLPQIEDCGHDEQEDSPQSEEDVGDFLQRILHSDLAALAHSYCGEEEGGKFKTH